LSDVPSPFGGTVRKPTRLWPGVDDYLRLTKGGKTIREVLDCDGNGTLDAVKSENGTWQIQLNVNDPKPNLLIAMENGLGGTTELLYASSTRFVSEETDVANDGGDGVSDLPFVTWVVTGIRERDGRCRAPDEANPFIPGQNPCIDAGHERNALFRYRDGRYDSVAREFRGFRLVEREDMDGNVARTTFGQDDATKGRVLQVETYAGSAATGIVVRREYNLWASEPFPGTQAGRAQLWLGFTERETYDLGDNPPHLLVTANDRPDTYGNVTHTYTQGATPADRVDTYTEYAVPLAPSHVHDKPWHTTVWAGGTKLSEQWFTYDGIDGNGIPLGKVEQGNVKMVQAWLKDLPDPKTYMTYDAYGNVVSVTDPRGNVSKTRYDDQALYPKEEENALGHITRTVMDYRWGKPALVADPNLRVMEYAYDEAGRIKMIARPGDTLEWTNSSERYTYEFGSPAENEQPATLSTVVVQRKEPNNRTDAEGDGALGYVTRKASFDALGRPQYAEAFRIVNGQGQWIRSGQVEYDAGGRIKRQYDPYPASLAVPNNGVTAFDYHLNGSGVIDPLGRLYQVTQVDGTTRKTLYDRFTVTTVDEENQKVVTTTDTYGRTVRTDVYAGNTIYTSTSHTYDGLGRLLTTTQNANPNTTITHTYDSLGRKTQTVDPDSGTWTYKYDKVGNLVYQNDPKAGATPQHVEFCYDALNRVKRKYYFDVEGYQGITNCDTTKPQQITYTYDGQVDGVGRLKRVEDLSGMTTFEYDERGRTISTTKTIVTADGVAKTAKTTFGYDGADHLLWTRYPDGELVRTGYDESGQPITLQGAETYVSATKYDLFGRLTELQHGNGVLDWREYYGAPGSDSFSGGHRLSALGTQAGAAYHLDLTYSAYTRRAQLSTLRDHRNPSGVLANTADFRYDALGRLTDVLSLAPGLAAAYRFDNLGNITQKEQRRFYYETGAKPHQVTKVCEGSTCPSTLTCTGAGCMAITHDANGNRAINAYTGQSYQCDKDDRVTQIEAGGHRVELLYDYTGLRVAETVRDTANYDAVVSQTRTYGDLAEATDDGFLTKSYFLGGLRVASRREDKYWLFARADGGAIEVAQVGLDRPALLLLVHPDAHGFFACTATVLALGLLLAPWRRKRVVGLAVRHGHVIGVLILFTASTLPWPLVVRPAWADGGGGGGSGPTRTPTATPTVTPTPRTGPRTWHYHLDHLGSTQVITDESGAIVEQIRYTAYGEIRGRWDANGTRLDSLDPDHNPNATHRHEFTGYKTEMHSGLQYAGARYYDPALGSFVTHDSARQFANPYTYTGWDPVNGVDPDGNWTFLGFTAEQIVVALFVANVVASTIQTGIETGSFSAAVRAGGTTAAFGAMGLVGLGLVGNAIETISFTAKAAFDAATFGAGLYNTAEGFRSGQYAVAAVGVVSAAFAIYGLSQDIRTGSASVEVKPGAAQGATQTADGEDSLAGTQFADSREGIVINDASQQSDFDRFTDFVREQGIERSQADAPYINEQVADTWGRIPESVQNYNELGPVQRGLDTFNTHGNSTRLPGGYHVVTEAPGGPVYVHHDVHDMLQGLGATYRHIRYEAVPALRGQIPTVYRNRYPDWRP
jgi:RHS repeat-associated protein